MKITREYVSAVISWCHANNVMYCNYTPYGSAVKMALKGKKRTPNGVLYHLPRTVKGISTGFSIMHPAGLIRLNRAYIMWQGESIPEIEMACAFILMTTDRQEICLVRVKPTSRAGKEIEACEFQKPSSESASG